MTKILVLDSLDFYAKTLRSGDYAVDAPAEYSGLGEELPDLVIQSVGKDREGKALQEDLDLTTRVVEDIRTSRKPISKGSSARTLRPNVKTI